jgi:Methyltransferase domain
MGIQQGEKSDMACPICSAEMKPCFTAQVLGKYPAQYEVCNECGFLRAHEPHWLDEAYSSAIAAADTGLVQRNIAIAIQLASIIYFKLDYEGAFLDVAGGYGMLVRLMRDFGFDFYWEDKYCANLLARGFEAEKLNKPIVALTAFEVIEHVHDPLAFIQETMERHGSRTLLFTTKLYEGLQPPPKDWWYYVFNTGQHISFYQRKTFERLAERLSLNFFSLNGMHILTDQSIRITLLLRVATGRFAPYFAPFIVRWIKGKLGSLTFADHFMLVGKSEVRPKG